MSILTTLYVLPHSKKNQIKRLSIDKHTGIGVFLPMFIWLRPAPADYATNVNKAVALKRLLDTSCKTYYLLWFHIHFMTD